MYLCIFNVIVNYFNINESKQVHNSHPLMTPNRYFYLVMFMIFVYMGLIVFLADCLVRVNDIIEDINYISCLNDKDCRTEQRI